MRSKISYIVMTALFIIAFILLADLLLAAIGVSLWNKIMVEVFSLPALTFWQFYGLMILIDVIVPHRFQQQKKDD